MKLLFTKSFVRDYQSLPGRLQAAVDKKIEILLVNPHHPSLRVKKMEGRPDVWEGRINRGYRFTFQILDDVYLLRRLGTHDVLKTP